MTDDLEKVPDLPTPGLETPEKIDALTEEQRRKIAEGSEKPVAVDRPTSLDTPVLSPSEEMDALKDALDLEHKRTDLEVAELETKEAKTGTVPGRYKAGDAMKTGIGIVLGAGGTLLMQFLKGCG